MERTLGSATVSNIRSSSTAHRSLVGTVRLWHVATGQELIVLRGNLGMMVWSVAFSHDGRSLAMGSGFTQAGKPTGEVIVWQAADPEPTRTNASDRWFSD